MTGCLPPSCINCTKDHHPQCLADGERSPCACGCFVSTTRYLQPVLNARRGK